MDCEHAINLISARLDQEIAPEETALLEDHLQTCASCRATAEAFQLQDADLRRTFEPRREAAAMLAEHVVQHLPAAPATAQPATSPAHPKPRWWALAVAALLIVGAGALLFSLRNTNQGDPGRAVKLKDVAADPLRNNSLVPRARPAPPEPHRLAVGKTLQTLAGEKRRVILPDGSVLFVNQNSKVKFDADRHILLDKGEVFVEVAPQEESGAATNFVVKTVQRELTAHGTKFAVRADAKKTGVFVTQGKVKVSGLTEFVCAGQQLAPEASEPTAAPRASCTLDWTRELLIESETPLVPGSKFAGGALVAVDANGQEAKLSLRNFHVDVHIEDGFARTTIDQTYFNHTPWRLEGTFYFPLPADASLNRLAMYVNGNLMEGGMAERDYAAQVYDRVKRSMRDPALLEWVDGTTFKMRVFPLEGRQEKRIILSYVQRLPVNYGRTQYRFPAGHSLQVVDHWSFHAVVKNGSSLVAASPSHPDMKIKPDQNDLVLDVATRNAPLNRDVVLDLVEPPQAHGLQPVGLSRFTTYEQDGARYLMLRYRPELSHNRPRERRDWIVLFESSADRDPLLARVQVEVIRNLLADAEHDDTFAVVTANSRVHTFAPERLPVTPANIDAAMEFLDQSHLVGALNLGEALTAAATFCSDAECNPYLIHIGSGFTALGAKREAALAERIPAGTRYVGVGVGKQWSRSFMKLAAERTGGHFTQINPDESIAWRSFELAATLNSPRLLNVKVADQDGKPFLTIANAIAQGEEVCAITRWVANEEMPRSVRITGNVDGRTFDQTVAVPP